MPDILDALFVARINQGDQDFWVTSLPKPAGFAVVTSARHRKWAIAQLAEGEFVDQRHFESVVDMAGGDLVKMLPFAGAPDAIKKKQLIKGLFLHVTNRCNLACKHCYYLKTPQRSHEDLELSNIEHLFENLKNRGLESVTLSGGEPTLHPEFSKIVELVHGYDLSLMILTNATSEMDKYAKLLRPNDLVLVSLHGPDANRHERQNGTGTFQRVLEGLNLLREFAPAENVIINCTISDWNIDHLDEMVELTGSLGLKRIRFMPLHSISGSTGSAPRLDYGSDKILRWARTAAQAISENRWPIQVDVGFSGLPGYLDDRIYDFGDDVCGIGQRLAVSSDGAFHLCPCLMDSEFKKDVSDLAANPGDSMPGLEKWGKLIRKRRDQIPKCRKCPLSGICQGGCPALAFQTSGSFQAVDPLCQAIQEFSFEYFSRLALKMHQN